MADQVLVPTPDEQAMAEARRLQFLDNMLGAGIPYLGPTDESRAQRHPSADLVADLEHEDACPRLRGEVSEVDGPRGGRARIRRCLDCGTSQRTWIVQPRPIQTEPTTGDVPPAPITWHLNGLAR